MKSLLLDLRSGLALLVLLFASALLVQYNASGVMNSDFHWHLINGNWILDHLQLPTADELSWTMNGKPYRLTQWGGEVLVAEAFRLGGPDGVRILVSAVAAGLFLVLYGVVRPHFTNALMAFGLTAALSAGSVLTMYGRPQVFSFLLFGLLIYLVDRWISTRKALYLAFIPFALALWANLHGGFPMGLLYLGVVATAILVQGYVQHDVKSAARIALPILAAGLVAMLFIGANPYGFDVWKSVFEIASSSVTRSKLIHEWRSPALSDLYGGQLVILIAATVAAAGFSRCRLSLRDVVIFLSFFLIAYDAQRNMPYFVMVMLPIIARLAAQTPMMDKLASQLPPSLSYRRQALILACAIPLLFVARLGLNGYGEKEERRFFATDAINYLVANGRTSRVMHDFNFGGYIAFHHPQVKVFADSRFDLYGDEFVMDFTRAMNGAPGYGDFIEKWRPETIMLPNGSPLGSLLTATGQYREGFVGQTQTVLLRQQP